MRDDARAPDPRCRRQHDARLATPTTAPDAPLPPVVLFPDIGGLRPAYEVKAQRIADGGYAVLLPNVYYRDVAGPVSPEGRSFREPDLWAQVSAYAGRLTPDALAGDFVALLAGVDAAPECAGRAGGGVAAIGYCMSGGFALRMAARHPDRVVAAAGFHSARLAPADDPHSPVSVVGSIRGRVYFGHADQDKSMPPDQIARRDRALAEYGVHFTTELFRGAAHGFTATDSPAYDAAADALHFKRVFTLLEETLR
ncbi:MAG TPA: dienelactone hydrolase family protein [Gemmatirosa sp.]